MTTIQATFLVTGLVLLPAAGFAMMPALSGRSGRHCPRGDRAFAGILAGTGAVLVILAALLGAWLRP